MFYRVVKLAVILFGLENWLISEAMDRTVEGTYMGFLIHITGKKALRKADGTWVTPRAELVWEVERTQSEMTYIGRRQGTMAQWVVLRPIFQVCTKGKGYEGGGRKRGAW